MKNYLQLPLGEQFLTKQMKDESGEFSCHTLPIH